MNWSCPGANRHIVLLWDVSRYVLWMSRSSCSATAGSTEDISHSLSHQHIFPPQGTTKHHNFRLQVSFPLQNKSLIDIWQPTFLVSSLVRWWCVHFIAPDTTQTLFVENSGQSIFNICSTHTPPNCQNHYKCYWHWVIEVGTHWSTSFFFISAWMFLVNRCLQMTLAGTYELARKCLLCMSCTQLPKHHGRGENMGIFFLFRPWTYIYVSAWLQMSCAVVNNARWQGAQCCRIGHGEVSYQRLKMIVFGG